MSQEYWNGRGGMPHQERETGSPAWSQPAAAWNNPTPDERERERLSAGTLKWLRKRKRKRDERLRGKRAEAGLVNLRAEALQS